jgi:8-oxo-dGTP pyrophosphatase MutT (NUDIX family)
MANRGPQQAAAIPFRRTGDNVQLCLIRRKDTQKRWGIPKGVIDSGDTPAETAVNEAWEEAGLVGRPVGDTNGSYKYDKWGKALTVAVFLLEVLDEEDTWDEDDVRERRWTAIDEALDLLSQHPVRPLLDHAMGLLTRGPLPRD